MVENSSFSDLNVSNEGISSSSLICERGAVRGKGDLSPHSPAGHGILPYAKSILFGVGVFLHRVFRNWGYFR